MMANEFYKSNENIKTLEIAVRHIRPEERGLLLIYLLHGEDRRTGEKYGTSGKEVVGFAISFPFSENAKPIGYVVNPTWVEEEEHYT